MFSAQQLKQALTVHSTLQSASLAPEPGGKSLSLASAVQQQIT